MISKAITKSATVLVAFAIATTALVTITYILTKPEIEVQKKLATYRILNEVLPAQLYDNALAESCRLTTDNNQQPIKIYRATKAGQPTAIAMESVTLSGYSGKIVLMLAMDMNGEILGVRTLEHKETPGLGDKIEIEKSSWITLFDGLIVDDSNRDRWKVRKDGGIFDQFTGATITPRAVVAAIKQSSEWFQNNKQNAFELPSNCETQS